MPNSIRTPKAGTPEHIREAVDDEGWQRFRLSLKGRTTEDKLVRLLEYYETETKDVPQVYIRVDNYLKALARGGQIAVSTAYVDGLRNGKLRILK